ncbi:hypothetical protein NQ176_g3092 [Zarea fungicola]|uniref:Uncharacterized protein n=1 Tax=Zarea fungicola TaxID=93591 RepID=A0ACC1NK97_9HYPO|nr:hypothetical protein NQ176_g3092 [Lecanicillium fungicola]
MWPLILASLILGLAIAVMFKLAGEHPVAKVPLRTTAGRVRAVCKSQQHVFSKAPIPAINLIKGLGVEGDCHLGRTVQHRSRLHIRPVPANLRQVHLIHSELFEQLSVPTSTEDKAHIINPGDLGENITTEGVDLLSLGEGTKLHFFNDGTSGGEEDHPIVRITGLRNPCPQIQKFQSGLQEKCLVRDEQRNIVARKAGVMSVVEVGGCVMTGAKIVVEQPTVHVPLLCV